MMPDFWERPRRCIEKYADGEKDEKARYLIIEKSSSQGVGYIELDYANSKMPEVDIAILKEYRRKGYAFEAAKVLSENTLKNESIKCIIWSAFRSNKASRSLLGGTIKEMMKAEMDDHLGYEKSERCDSDDYRNGYKRKRVNSRYGSWRLKCHKTGNQHLNLRR